jgi:hypothetical protein
VLGAPVLGAPVLGAPVLGPLGLGAVELAGAAELGVPVVVDGRELLSALAAPVLLGDGDPVCDVGVHATSAATRTEEAAARRRGCGRYISQLLRNGE